jgi:hypothetical protein
MIQFSDHANIAVIGCSSSGKTTLVANILRYATDLFPTTPSKFIFIYSIWQNEYDRLKAELENASFLQYIPDQDDIVAETEEHKHSVVVVDDFMDELADSKLISNLLTELSHHLKITTILITQNNAYGGKFKSNITKNTHYTILMNSPRDVYAVKTLGMQIGDYKNMLDIYKDVTKEGRYSYVLCDTHPLSQPQFRYRTHILPFQCCVIYNSQ